MSNPNFTRIIVPVIALTAVLLTVTSIAVLNSSQNVDFSGTITTVNVEVYSDQACTHQCSTINVGTLNPDDSFSQKIYVKNTGTEPVILSIATNNWNPTEAHNYLALSWNRQNYVLNAGLSVETTLTLTAAPNADAITTFGFTATITGTQEV